MIITVKILEISNQMGKRSWRNSGNLNFHFYLVKIGVDFINGIQGFGQLKFVWEAFIIGIPSIDIIWLKMSICCHFTLYQSNLSSRFWNYFSYWRSQCSSECSQITCVISTLKTDWKSFSSKHRFVFPEVCTSPAHGLGFSRHFCSGASDTQHSEHHSVIITSS